YQAGRREKVVDRRLLALFIAASQNLHTSPISFVRKQEERITCPTKWKEKVMSKRALTRIAAGMGLVIVSVSIVLAYAQDPNVKVQIEGKGSSTAPAALIAGTAQLGPMSRPMKATEMDQFEKKFGYKPTEIRTSVDALAVFVNKDNPIKSLTLTQVDAVFSK